MITTWVLRGILFVFENTVGSLPSSPTLGLNTKAAGVVGTGIFNGAGWVNAYAPLDAVMEGLGVVTTVFVVMWLIRIVLYVLTKLHVLGGGDD